MNLSRVNILAVLLTVFFAVSCAPARWEAKIVKQAEMVWPPPPNPVKASYLGEIKEFTQIDKSIISTIFGKSTEGQIMKPVAVAVGGDGRIAVVDAGRKGVHFFIPAREKYSIINMADSKNMLSPVSVVFDNKMFMYVSDSALKQIYVFDDNGDYVKKIDTVGKAGLGRPTGLTYNSQTDQLYVADTTTHQVHKFNSEGSYIGSVGSRGTGNMQFNMPTHIDSDLHGSLYVNDAMNFRAQVFSADDNFIAGFGHHGNGSGDFAMPKGIAVDRWGIIYVTETLFDRVQLFNIHGDYLLDIGAKGTNQAEFWMPSGSFIDRNDILYVCDTYNRRIQLFQLYSMGESVK